MAAAQPLPTGPQKPGLAPRLPETAELVEKEALLASAPDGGTGALFAPRSPIARLPVEVDIAIPVREFRVRNLLALEPGEVIETRWPHGDDLPVAAGRVALAWSEFEVIDTQLAVRLTRMS